MISHPKVPHNGHVNCPCDVCTRERKARLDDELGRIVAENHCAQCTRAAYAKGYLYRCDCVCKECEKTRCLLIAETDRRAAATMRRHAAAHVYMVFPRGKILELIESEAEMIRQFARCELGARDVLIDALQQHATWTHPVHHVDGRKYADENDGQLFVVLHDRIRQRVAWDRSGDVTLTPGKTEGWRELAITRAERQLKNGTFGIDGNYARDSTPHLAGPYSSETAGLNETDEELRARMRRNNPFFQAREGNGTFGNVPSLAMTAAGIDAWGRGPICDRSKSSFRRGSPINGMP